MKRHAAPKKKGGKFTKGKKGKGKKPVQQVESEHDEHVGSDVELETGGLGGQDEDISSSSDDERSESCESDMEDIDAEDDQFFDAMDMFDKSEDQVAKLISKGTDLVDESEEDEDVFSMSEGEDDEAGAKALAKSLRKMDRPEKTGHSTVMENRSEGAFNLSGKDGSVTLADLVETFDSGEMATTAAQDLKRQSKTTGTVAVSETQEIKADRKAAYEEASAEVEKWKDFVDGNRKLKTLIFSKPLKHNVTTASLATTQFNVIKNEPDSMEAQIQAILDANNMGSEKQIMRAEAEMEAKLDPEEIEERRNALAHERALLTRFEMKARRVKRIKSKKYHRILRREKERGLLDAGDIEGLSEEQLKEQAELAARQRAEERLLLRHKTSKWKKQALRFGKHDKTTRQMVSAQNKQGLELTEKSAAQILLDEMEGEDDEELVTDDSEYSELSDSEEEEEKKPHKLKIEDEDSSEIDSDDSDAEERREMHKQRRANREAEELRTSGAATGRRVFNAPPVAQKKKPIRAEKKNKEKKEAKEKDGRPSKARASEKVVIDETVQEKKVAPVKKDEQPTAKKKKGKKAARVSIVQPDGDEVKSEEGKDIKMNTEDAMQKALVNQAFTMQLPETTFDEDVAEAEATNVDYDGDNFEKAKLKAMEKEAGIDVKGDKTLPGWGDWGGMGSDMSAFAAKAKKRKRERENKRKRLMAEHKLKRTDRNLGHVIINSKQDKKMAAYQVNKPFGYTTDRAYNRSVEGAIGTEWNTPRYAARLRLRDVTTDAGVNIAAPELSKSSYKTFRAKQAKQKNMRKTKAPGKF